MRPDLKSRTMMMMINSVLTGFILTNIIFLSFLFLMRAKFEIVSVEEALVQKKCGYHPGNALIDITKKQTNKMVMCFGGRGYQALDFLTDYCGTYPRCTQKQPLAYRASLEMRLDGTGRIGLGLTH